MKIKILVCYHKRDILLKNEIFLPIHLGRATFDNSEQDQEKHWLYENLVGDNTGDNISSKNNDYCELTGIYWAWKNYDKLGNPDFIGFMHYRRWLSFDGWNIPKHPRDIIAVSLRSFLKRNDSATIQNVISTGNVFTRSPLPFFETPGHEECRKIGFDYLKTNYPNLYKIFLQQKQENKLYASNIFVMRKDDFFRYCEIIFDILSKYNSHELPREKGYFAEFVTSAYLEYLGQHYGSITLLPILTPHKNPVLRSLKLAFYKLLAILSFGKLKNFWKAKRESIKWLY